MRPSLQSQGCTLPSDLFAAIETPSPPLYPYRIWCLKLCNLSVCISPNRSVLPGDMEPIINGKFDSEEPPNDPDVIFTAALARDHNPLPLGALLSHHPVVVHLSQGSSVTWLHIQNELPTEGSTSESLPNNPCTLFFISRNKNVYTSMEHLH